MKTCGGMEPLILTPGNRWQWSASIDNKEPLVRNGRKAVWVVDCVWNEKAHARKPDFVFRKNGRVHLNRWWRQFSRLLAGEVYASAVVMLDTPCSKVVWRVLATHSIRQFPLHFPSRASPCAITFQLESKHGENEGQQLNCICQGTWRLSNQNALCICANRIVIFLKWGALDLYTLFLSADIVFSKKSQAGRILLNNVDLRFDTSKNNRSRGPFKTSRRLVYPNVKRVHQIQALYLVRRKLTLNLCDLPFGIKSPCLATNYSNSITKDRPFYDAIDPLLDLQFVYIC